MEKKEKKKKKESQGVWGSSPKVSSRLEKNYGSIKEAGFSIVVSLGNSRNEWRRINERRVNFTLAGNPA